MSGRAVVFSVAILIAASAASAVSAPRHKPDCTIIITLEDGTKTRTQMPVFGPGQKPKPFAYYDAKSDTTFHVENDGRHVTATDAKGKQIWRRDPFIDANLCPYRTARPIVDEIKSMNEDYTAMIARWWKRKSTFVHLYFDSSQFGAVDIKNGDFLFEGQN